MAIFKTITDGLINFARSCFDTLINILKNREIKFAISCIDLFIEIIYKTITNQRSLIAGGLALINRIAFCCVSFSCYMIHKINQYYNQYYQPGKEKIIGLSYIDEWMQSYIIYLFIPVITFAKMIIDLNHLQNTQIIVVYQMLGFSYWLSIVLMVYVSLTCIESIVDAMFNWFNTLNGKKAEQSSKPWVASGSKLLAKFQTYLGYLNSFVESIFNVLLVFFGIAYGSLLTKCLVAGLLIISTATSVIVKRRVWLMMQKKDDAAKAQETSSLKQLYFLVMLLAIVLTPAVQFGIILLNVNIFFGVAQSTFASMLVAVLIVSTFIIQRFILKGDQFCKFLFGVEYDTKGFYLFGMYISGKPTKSHELGTVDKNNIPVFYSPTRGDPKNRSQSHNDLRVWT